MAEWENVPLDPGTKKKKKKKQLVNLKPPRPMATRLKKKNNKKKHRVKLEPPRPMAARLINTGTYYM